MLRPHQLRHELRVVDNTHLYSSCKSLLAVQLPSPLRLRFELSMSSDRRASGLGTSALSQQAAASSSNEDEYALPL
jgi:hypothetical protein